jgi:2-haloacid dehalogenase
MAIPEVKALVFDTFGTVVDWRTTLIREGEELGRKKSIQIDWSAFADAWREQEKPLQEKVRSGELPWANRDGLHRIALEELLMKFGVVGLSDEEKRDFNLAWHRLEPWPDAVPGLTRLRQRYLLAPLSNAGFACLTHIAKRAGIPWDCILTAEMARTFKPAPEAYGVAMEYLELPAEQVMMVAAHPYDLRAAQSVGMRTALVPRPQEWGPGGKAEDPGDSRFDVLASDFLDLAAQMGS